MNVYDIFESQLPIINVKTHGDIPINSNKINLKASYGSNNSGSFFITNIGHGTLSGSIYSDNTIIFQENNFLGNNIEIFYSINVQAGAGDTLYTEVVIASNGGEVTLEFIIEIVPPTLIAHNRQMENLKDFYEFWLDNPSFGKKIFAKHDFLFWLYQQNYEYMDIYEEFRNDANKDRGISNFFVFNSLIEPASLALVNKTVSLNINPYKNEDYSGHIQVARKNLGFINEKLEHKAPWLKLEKYEITHGDFPNKEDILKIGYKIDKSLIYNKSEEDTVHISGSTGKVKFKVNLLKFLEASLESNYLTLKDEYYLKVKNNTDHKLNIEITSTGNFLKFEKEAYTINDQLEIPFFARLSTLQLAQKSIRKIPVFHTNIRIKSSYKDKNFYEDIKLTIGDFH